MRSRSKITSYSFGRIEVEGKTYTADIIILPDKIIPNWWRKAGHELCLEDIEAVFEAKPEVLVVGTGASGMMKVLPEVKNSLTSRNIELIAHTTDEAVKVFNRFFSTRKAAAALHLTC